jgi:phage terminase small subunit
MATKRKKGLAGKAKRFADEYLVDCNATRAYKAAGYRAKDAAVAATMASRLLRNAQVAAYVAKRKKTLADKLEVTAERVVRELARIGFSDPRLVASWGSKGVELKESKTLDDDAAACLAEVHSKHGEFGLELKFKLHDKVAALDKLARHLGLFSEDNKRQLTVSFAELVAGSMTPDDGGAD